MRAETDGDIGHRGRGECEREKSRERRTEKSWEREESRDRGG